MSARNSHANKAARRLARGERVERKGAADRIGSSGNTSPAGLRRLSQMQGRQAGPKLKTIPQRLELKEHVAWLWKMARQAPPVAAPSKPERKPWPPWLEDAKRARAGKRRAA